MSRYNVTNEQILMEVQLLSGALTSLTRTVGRIDQRLIDVEKHMVDMQQQTKLIPGLVEAVMGFSSDIDNHKRRLKRLEKLPA